MSIYTSREKYISEMNRDETSTDACAGAYDKQYVSEWHEDLQSMCLTCIFMTDCLEGIS
jgi:hypothetical protein